jgi:hypothetical protein
MEKFSFSSYHCHDRSTKAYLLFTNKHLLALLALFYPKQQQLSVYTVTVRSKRLLFSTLRIKIMTFLLQIVDRVTFGVTVVSVHMLQHFAKASLTVKISAIRATAVRLY